MNELLTHDEIDLIVQAIEEKQSKLNRKDLIYFNEEQVKLIQEQRNFFTGRLIDKIKQLEIK